MDSLIAQEEPELVYLPATVPSPMAQEEPKLIDTPTADPSLFDCLHVCVVDFYFSVHNKMWKC